jgi:DDE family transposase
MERRLQRRYEALVRAHVKLGNLSTAGPAIPADQLRAHTATQATWRFLNNERVTLSALVHPLREAGRVATSQSRSPFVLVVHDWCKLDFKTHTAKTDVIELTHENDVGYDLTTSLLVDAGMGAPLAPVQMHLATAKKVHSTAIDAPSRSDHHLEQLLPTMDEIAGWHLPRRPVHIIDREADSLGHFRQWTPAGHLFLVRADDRRVLWDGTPKLLSEIAKELDLQGHFQETRQVLYQGKMATQLVAEAHVVLHKPHKTRRGGKQYEVPGPPIPLRLIVARVVDEKGNMLAEWLLLTNVPADEMPATGIALWYYWRWRIESFFKLLKSHGFNAEGWQQETGLAIARRLLVAAMACVVIWNLQHDASPASEEFKQVLVKLSGRSMKYGVKYTAPALLAGYFAYLMMADFLSTSPYSLHELQSLARQSGISFDNTA